ACLAWAGPSPVLRLGIASLLVPAPLVVELRLLELRRHDGPSRRPILHHCTSATPGFSRPTRRSAQGIRGGSCEPTPGGSSLLPSPPAGGPCALRRVGPTRAGELGWSRLPTRGGRCERARSGVRELCPGVAVQREIRSAANGAVYFLTVMDWGVG